MRINSLKFIVVFLFLISIFSFFHKQIISYPQYKTLSEKNRIRIRSIPAPRGLIFDRHSRVLAGNKILFSVAVIPQEVKEKQFVFNLLSDVLNKSADGLLKNYKKNYIAPFAPVIVADDISRETAIKLEERSLFLPGVIVATVPSRFYPLKEEICHVTGYLGEINSEELDKLKPYGYRIKELIGKDGIEKVYNSYLKGERGGIQVEVDNRGREVKILGYKAPEKGNDIQLTIDSRLQEQIYDALKEYTGAAIVINPNTGEILAMCSSPGFDPNMFIGDRDDKEINYLLNSSHRPLLNRSIQAVYPPGSIFKTLIAAAALQEGKINTATTIVCKGEFVLGKRSFACWDKDGHGEQTVIYALKNSCNVFFYTTGLLLGVDLIYKYAEEFGLTQLTGIDLPSESTGVVPNAEWKKQQLGQPWYAGETVNYAIGQGYLCLTPIQVLRMICVIANGGKLVKPYLVEKIGDVRIEKSGFKEVRVDKKYLDIVKEGMAKVANTGGTGYRVMVDGLQIAGKTGTAQTSQGKTHAWFAGFTPVDKPKIAVVVVLEHGGKGGLGAVDVARKAFLFVKENYDLEKDF
ncbi:MAG: penicillin-binding protein 2 [Candidatus Omnitrophota bacterium]